MKIYIFFLFGIFSVLIVTCNIACAQGGPPMLTDDSGTPGDGKWEDNFAFVFSGTRNNYTKDFPIADFNYGLGERIQLKAEMAWVAGKGDNVAGKFDYFSLGCKYRFLDEQRDGISLSTYPQPVISFTPTEKSRSVDYGILIPLSASKELLGFSATLQLGYNILGTQSSWIYGIALSHDIGRTTVIAEIHSESTIQTFLDLGAQIYLSDTYTILAAIGKDIASPSFSSGNANFYGYFGLQVHL